MDLKDRILAMTDNGLDIFKFYLGTSFRLKKNFLNPDYADTKPGCNIFLNAQKKAIMHDFGDPYQGGDCFTYVAKLKGLNCKDQFPQLLREIIRDMNLPIYDADLGHLESGKSYVPPRETKPKPQPKPKPAMKKYKFTQAEWNSAHLLYWEKYGIGLDTLNKYNVRPLQSFSSVGEKGPYEITGSTVSPMFGYIGEGYMKIYRPHSDMRFMYAGKLPSPCIFGLQQLPTHGDILFITGGEKDVMSLAAHGFNAICFNSETATIPEATVEMLSLRFRHIIVMYDSDETGLKAMEKAREDLAKYRVLTLALPLKGNKVEKDISDFFAKGKTEKDLGILINDILDETYQNSLMMIRSCEMDFSKPPIKSKVVISADGVPIGSYDNLLCVTGSEGTGKSNFVSSLLAGTFLTKEQEKGIDTLGFKVTPNFEEYAVLHFDTEQSEYQMYKNMDMTVRRAKMTSTPGFYHSFFLAPLSRKDRLQLICDAMDYYHHQYGGLHLVVIDGVADLVTSANNETECVAVVEELYRLASMYHTCILCVLHFVPNGLKLRGHIGSELQRKAASILSIEKDEDESASVVKTLKVREGNPLEVPMYLFSWSKQENMFVSAGQKNEEARKSRKAADLKSLATTILSKGDLTYSDLVQTIMDEMEVANRTAKDYVSSMYKNGFITKSGDKYTLKIQK